MPLTVTIRGSNTDSAASGTDATFEALGALPNLLAVNEVKTSPGGATSRAPGARYTYTVRTTPFALSNDAGFDSFADANALQRVLTLYRYHWLYSVTGAPRKDALGNDWWASHNLPAAITVIGQPRLSAGFDGFDAMEFDIGARAVIYS